MCPACSKPDAYRTLTQSSGGSDWTPGIQNWCESRTRKPPAQISAYEVNSLPDMESRSTGTHSCVDQLPLRECPEITTAWRHHRQLISCLGRARICTAWQASSWINWRWYQQARQPSTFRLRHRILSRNDRIPQKQAAAAAAALYLPTAALASVIASPYWEKIAHSKHPQPFLDRIKDEVTEGWLPPQGIYDPLRQWMLEDRAEDLVSDSVSPPGPCSQPHDSLPCDNSNEQSGRSTLQLSHPRQGQEPASN